MGVLCVYNPWPYPLLTEAWLTWLVRILLAASSVLRKDLLVDSENCECATVPDRLLTPASGTGVFIGEWRVKSTGYVDPCGSFSTHCTAVIFAFTRVKTDGIYFRTCIFNRSFGSRCLVDDQQYYSDTLNLLCAFQHSRSDQTKK